jgi:membrane protease YdiL (CAAX protease family)
VRSGIYQAYASKSSGLRDSLLREKRVRESPSSEWVPILAFIVLANAVTWLACLLLRSTFAAGHLWALFTFLFVTVWSPTVIALALSFSFEGAPGVRNLLGSLFRGFSKTKWYVIGILVPVAAVATAIIIARHAHSGANFIPLAALPVTVGLQIVTGAMGEELGWRGFLLPRLEGRLTPRLAALVMAITWALWHLPAFFFPGLPQQHLPPMAFLLMVAAFGIFLALLSGVHLLDGCNLQPRQALRTVGTARSITTYPDESAGVAGERRTVIPSRPLHAEGTRHRPARPGRPTRFVTMPECLVRR